MPMLTRAQKRPADEAPEIDDSRKDKKPGSGAHSTGQASVKKKKQQARRKSAERRRAPPEKQAAVQAENTAQHQARRADLPEEDKAAEQARNAAQHQARRGNLPDEDRAAIHAQDAAQHAARFAAMSPAEQQDFNALKAATEAQRVAAMPPAEQQAFYDHKAEKQAQRVAGLPEDRRVTRQMTRARAEAARIEHLPPERLEEHRVNRSQDESRYRIRQATTQAALDEATRQGKPTCDINAHLEYCTQGGSTPGRYGAQDVLDEMEESSTDFEDRWKQAKLYEAKLRERMYDTRPCACCGIRVPEASMQRDVREGPESPLNLLISVESDKQPNPTRVRLQNGTQDYVLHSSYAGEPTVSWCLCAICVTDNSPGRPSRDCLASASRRSMWAAGPRVACSPTTGTWSSCLPSRSLSAWWSAPCGTRAT